MKKHLVLLIPIATLWALPVTSCSKKTDTSVRLKGTVTEFGTNAPIEDAVVYLVCDNITSSDILDTVHTDANGYFEFFREDYCGGEYLFPYKEGFLQHQEIYLGTGDQTHEIVMDPEAWLKIRGIPSDGDNTLQFQVHNFATSFQSWFGDSTMSYPSVLKGGLGYLISGKSFPSNIQFQDSIFLIPHDTTTYTIHY